MGLCRHGTAPEKMTHNLLEPCLLATSRSTCLSQGEGQGPIVVSDDMRQMLLKRQKVRGCDISRRSEFHILDYPVIANHTFLGI